MRPERADLFSYLSGRFDVRASTTPGKRRSLDMREAVIFESGIESRNLGKAEWLELFLFLLYCIPKTY